MEFAQFNLTDLVDRQAAGDRAYFEFLRVPSMSAGLYVLPAGSTDGQSPHNEDEVYYVAEGRARFRAGEQVTDVTAGSFLFVQAGVDHRFFDITEDLRVLVLFAPAET